MPFSTGLYERMRPMLLGRAGMSEKKMFGGVGFLVHGNICAGIFKDFLILRLGEEGAETALQKEHVKQFDITGKPMRGWVMVGPLGYEASLLLDWLNQACTFTESLPRK